MSIEAITESHVLIAGSLCDDQGCEVPAVRSLVLRSSDGRSAVSNMCVNHMGWNDSAMLRGVDVQEDGTWHMMDELRYIFTLGDIPDTPRPNRRWHLAAA